MFESALQMVSDFPEAYKGQKEFAFIKAAPGHLGRDARRRTASPATIITVARRRGREWFVGSITGWKPNEMDLPFEFLGRGDFVAEIYSDAADAKRIRHTPSTRRSASPRRPCSR